MKRYIKAADSDYIKIGNRILPKNAMDMGYDSYETISRKAQQAYDAEKEEERKAAEKAEKEAAAKEYIDAFNRIYAEHKDDSNVDDLMEALFDEFVPMSGPTNSLAAEFIRAIERIRYRAYNDGDKFYTGYGLETAAPSAAFLADNLSEELARKIENIADHDAAWPDSQYLEALDSLAGDIVEYIADNLHLFGEGTTDSRDYDAFMIAFTQSGIPIAVANKMIERMKTNLPKWKELIDQSFLPDKMKANYCQLLKKRIELL